MTQEEKFKEAKRLYETANADQRYVLETLFPELKESEDERIIERIKKAVEYYWSDEPLEEILAWLEKQGEKKPWSEEDEVKINRIVACLENLNVADNDILLKDIDWLKSLKPQSQQEWSENTQQWIDAIIKDYEGWYDADKDHRATIQTKINILKSLRSQPQWKPSESDIMLLKRIMDGRSNPKDFQASLGALIEQLKEL